MTADTNTTTTTILLLYSYYSYYVSVVVAVVDVIINYLKENSEEEEEAEEKKKMVAATRSMRERVSGHHHAASGGLNGSSILQSHSSSISMRRIRNRRRRCRRFSARPRRYPASYDGAKKIYVMQCGPRTFKIGGSSHPTTRVKAARTFSMNAPRVIFSSSMCYMHWRDVEAAALDALRRRVDLYAPACIGGGTEVLKYVGRDDMQVAETVTIVRRALQSFCLNMVH